MFARIIRNYFADKSVGGLVGLATLAGLLTLTGPFGTFETLGFLHRGLFWTVIVLLAMITAALAHALSLRAAGIWQLSSWRREALRLLLVVCIFSPVAYAALEFLDASAGHRHHTSFGVSVAYVAGIAGGLRVLNTSFPPIGLAAAPAEAPLQAEMPPPAGDAHPRLMQRLPNDFAGPVLRLAGKGHFVEVISDTGAVTLRMRLGDAIAEMEPVAGVVPHRSHWVRRDAVSGSRQEAGKLELCLSNGDRIPVSRGMRRALEDQAVI